MSVCSHVSYLCISRVITSCDLQCSMQLVVLETLHAHYASIYTRTLSHGVSHRRQRHAQTQQPKRIVAAAAAMSCHTHVGPQHLIRGPSVYTHTCALETSETPCWLCCTTCWSKLNDNCSLIIRPTRTAHAMSVTQQENEPRVRT